MLFVNIYLFLVKGKHHKSKALTLITIHKRAILSYSIFSGRSRDSSVGIATGYGLDDQGRQEFECR
jgi:hypothetical protein